MPPSGRSVGTRLVVSVSVGRLSAAAGAHCAPLRIRLESARSLPCSAPSRLEKSGAVIRRLAFPMLFYPGPEARKEKERNRGLRAGWAENLSCRTPLGPGPQARGSLGTFHPWKVPRRRHDKPIPFSRLSSGDSKLIN